MSSPIFDQPHLADIGAEYECFVGAYYKKVLKCTKVFYTGLVLGKEDGGIDIIALSEDCVYLIQCKNYMRGKVIRENHVNQLGGAARTFMMTHADAYNIKPVLVSTVAFSQEAEIAAKANEIELKQLMYSKKTIDDKLVYFNDEFTLSDNHDYRHALFLKEKGFIPYFLKSIDSRLRDQKIHLTKTPLTPEEERAQIIEFNSHYDHPAIPMDDLPSYKPEPEQTASKSEQIVQKPEQTTSEPKQIVQKPEQITRQKRSKAIRTHLIILLLELCGVFDIFAYLVPIAAFFAAMFLLEFFTEIRVFETVPFLGFLLAGLASISGIALKDLCQERLERKIKQKKSELP